MSAASEGMTVYLVLDAGADGEPMHVAISDERARAWISEHMRRNPWRREDQYDVLPATIGAAEELLW